MITHRLGFLVASFISILACQFSSLKAQDIEVWCTYKVGGHTISVGNICPGWNTPENCEECKDDLQAQYAGNVLVCGDCEQIFSMLPTKQAVSQDPAHWKVTYRCNTNDGNSVSLTAPGSTYCEALNKAKAAVCRRVQAMGLCCSTTSTEVIQRPCPIQQCKPVCKPVCKPKKRCFGLLRR
jgi:hypothetical protein